MWVYNLPGKPGDVYEVLCDAPGWTASAGTFTVDAQGNAYVVLTTAMKKGHYDQIRIVRREHLARRQDRDLRHPRGKAGVAAPEPGVRGRVSPRYETYRSDRGRGRPGLRRLRRGRRTDGDQRGDAGAESTPSPTAEAD